MIASAQRKGLSVFCAVRMFFFLSAQEKNMFLFFVQEFFFFVFYSEKSLYIIFCTGKRFSPVSAAKVFSSSLSVQRKAFSCSENVFSFFLYRENAFLFAFYAEKMFSLFS